MAKKLKNTKALKRVGLWATIWWAVSGLYLVLLVWQAQNYYLGFEFSVHEWLSSCGMAFANSVTLQLLLYVIVLVWVVGGFVWLKALKQAKISYKDGFKDLFLTLR